MRSSAKILIVVGSTLLVGGGFFLFRGHAQQEVLRRENEALLAAIGKLVLLPQETPVIATVVDLDKLKGQAFFAKAQRGDKVLIYTREHKAILYNPTEGRVVEFAPFGIGAQ